MTSTDDRTFDRIPSPPSESARYPIPFRAGPELRDVDWTLTGDFPLDQGVEGACVGFGLAAELSAIPISIPTGNSQALDFYQGARGQDREMGYDFPSGATVLGGLRHLQKTGRIAGYRWAERFEDILGALQEHGSVVMGTDWFSGMDSPDAFGVVEVSGSVRGGHCWTVVGYWRNHPVAGECYVAINSWGDRFGDRGRFLIKPDGLRRLFERGGEAAIVTDVEVVPVPEPEPPAPPKARKWPKIPRWFREWLRERNVVEGQD